MTRFRKKFKACWGLVLVVDGRKTKFYGLAYGKNCLGLFLTAPWIPAPRCARCAHLRLNHMHELGGEIVVGSCGLCECTGWQEP